MKSLLVIAVLVCAASAASYPSLVLTGVRDSGVSTLSSAYQQAVSEVNAAVEAFIPINATCTEKYYLAVNSCSECVKEKCTARAEQACQQSQPTGWEAALVTAIGIITEDIPNVFTETIPDVFVNTIGGGIVDITKEAGDFFENTIGGGIVDLGNTIGDELIGVGNDLVNFGENAVDEIKDAGEVIADGIIGVGEDFADGIVDFGEGFVDGITDFGEGFVDGLVDVGDAIEGVAVDGFNTVKDGIDTAVGELEDFGHSIGHAFRKIGKRSVSLRRRRRETEPDCSQFQSDATAACQFYLKASYCSSCAFSSETDCPGYADALDLIEQVNAANIWLSEITNKQYTINEMSYDTQNFDPATGGFSNVLVKAHLFGKDLEFTIGEAIQPYEPDVSGPVVADYALQAFKGA